MFEVTDFDIFKDTTLAGRMTKIRDIIDPKFDTFATKALPVLAQDGQVWYAHVAKHLRRVTNAPDNTWVAFAPNKRGYKMMPHFELGLWEDNLYLFLAVEENMKPKALDDIVPKLRKITDDVLKLPEYFVLSPDHMVSATQPLTNYNAVVDRFANIKHSEVLIGVTISRDDTRFGTLALDDYLLKVLEHLLPLYQQLK